MQKRIKNYVIMILGAMVIGFGVAFIVYGNVGGDAMTTFEQGIANTLNVSLPMALILANALFIVLLFFLSRKNISIDTLLSPLFISLGSKVAILFVPGVNDVFMRYIYLGIGLVIAACGIGIGAQSPTGSNPYDGFVLALSHKIQKSYSIVRPIFDGVILVIGILLKGSFGIGTFIAIICMGPIANYFIRFFSKIKKNNHII